MAIRTNYVLYQAGFVSVPDSAPDAVPDSAPDSRAGSSIVNVDPSPSLDHTEIVPPHSCTQCLVIASPSPEPPVARDRAGSTR